MADTKITFILHYFIKSVSSLKSDIESLFSESYTIQYKTTDKASGAENGVREALEEKAEIIIICGGDGSINEAVNAYLGFDNPYSLQWGVLPLGRGNDFSRSLGVNNSLKELKLLIEQKKTIDVSIFKANFLDKSQNPSCRYYVNIADIGLGGYVAENVSNSSKILGASITYIKAIVASFMIFKKQLVQLTSDSFEWEGNMMSLCMANGKYFGSGMCIAPDADISDNQLQLTIIGNVSLWDYFKNLNNIKKGYKIDHKEVCYTAVNGCKIISKGIPCPIDMDGEFIGYTPIEVQLADHKMRFYGGN